LVAEGFHVYVFAPAAVSVRTDPIHKEGVSGVIVIIGTGAIGTFTVF
jgi:hypothetical protein